MAAKDDLKQAEEALKDPKFKGPYRFEGEEYTLSQLRDVLIPLLKKRRDTEAKRKQEVETGFANLSQRISAAEKRVVAAQETLNRDRNAFSKGNLSEAELAKSESRLAEAQSELARLGSRERFPTPEREATGGQRQAAPDVAAEIAGFRGSVTPPESDKTDKTGGKGKAAAPKKVTRANVTAELTKRGLPDTPENRATVRAELEGKTGATDWESRIAAEAGEYAYLMDPKFEGVPELLRKAVQQGWFKSEEGQKEFLRELKKTPYALNADANQERFDLSDPGTKRRLVETQIDKIRSEYGDIQFDQATLEEVATTAARNGSSAIELGRLVYRAAFKQGAASPVYTTPVAAKTALGGADANRIRAIYRAYGQRADDQMIARILANEVDPASGVVMTEDMLRNNLRDIAKVSYKPFADLLDRGVSVETIFQPYQSLAARVLEKSPEQVSLLDENGVPTQFASALMAKEPMSLTDWVTMLKADERYGWQFTSEAKQRATSLVMEMEKAFGFRR